MKTTIIDFVSLLWQDLINILHRFDRHSKDEDVKAYSEELRKEGIIRIGNFLPAETCDLIRKEIEALAHANEVSTDLENGTSLNYRNQDNKDGPDHGMLDIFHVDKAIPQVLDIDQDQLIKIVESCSGQEVIPLRINAYYNDGVKNTRGYHIDNAQPVIYKAFIYLTDVPDTSYGPYSFVKRSQQLSIYPYFNFVRNLFLKKYRSTDMPVYRKGQVENCTGKKGDLILSNQNAIHRGLSQELGKKRVAIIFNYLIKSRLSYFSANAKKQIPKKPEPVAAG